MSAKVKSQQVSMILRMAARGDCIVYLFDMLTWDEAYAGDVTFIMNGWLITLFNDCDSVDYVTSCVSPAGKIGDYDDWQRRNPLQALTNDERGALAIALKNAKKPRG